MTSKRDIIKRWIQKVESDLKTARILMEFEGSPKNSSKFIKHKSWKNTRYNHLV